MTDALAILALTAASHAALGVAVWRSQPSGPANRAFACLALTLGAWTLSNGLVTAYAHTPWGIVWARSAFFSAFGSTVVSLSFFVLILLFSVRANLPRSRWQWLLRESPERRPFR